MTASLLIFIVVIAALVAISISTIMQAQAQQNQTNQTTLSIAGFTGKDARKAMDKEYKIGLSLQLHNASKAKQDESNAKYYLFDCITDVVDPDKNNMLLNSTLSICDGLVTKMIVNHELGNNQTMIKAAYAYLKSRGIQ